MEPTGDAAGELDQPVDALGSAVVGTAGGEVAQERGSPLVQSAAETGDLWDRARRERGEDLLCDPAAVGGTRLVVDRAQLVGVVAGDLDCDVAVIDET